VSTHAARGLIASLAMAGFALARAAEPAPATPGALPLSPGVKALLTAEMLEVAKGMQAMALSVATADWTTIASTSRQIRASYIMEKTLTPAQAAELVVHHYSRLLETCTVCHAAYARARLAGFAAPPPAGHQP
jgi:hypothetical protein